MPCTLALLWQWNIGMWKALFGDWRSTVLSANGILKSSIRRPMETADKIEREHIQALKEADKISLFIFTHLH
jgi:hypothetical protein